MAYTYYFIKSKSSGHVLDVTGASASPGVQVIAWIQTEDQDNQQWRFDDETKTVRTKLDDSFVLDLSDVILVLNEFEAGKASQRWQRVDGDRLLNVDDPTYCIDLCHSDPAPGATVIRYPYYGTQNQLWDFETVSRRKFYIVSQVHGKVVGIRPGTNLLEIQQKADPPQDSQLFYDGDEGFLRSAANNLSLSAQQGAQLSLTQDNHNAWEHWKFDDAGVKVLSGYSGALDIEAGNEDDGTNVISWEGHDGIHQKWGREFVSTPDAGDTTPPPPDRQKFYIVSQVHGKVVGIRPGTNQLEIQQKADPTQDSQLFYDGDDGFLRSAANNLSLSAQKGAQLSLTEDGPNAWDHWKFDDAGVNVLSGDSDALDIEGGNEDDGANVVSWEVNDGNNQKWGREFVSTPDTGDTSAPPPPPPARRKFYIVSQVHGKVVGIRPGTNQLEIQQKADPTQESQLFYDGDDGFLRSAANNFSLSAQKGAQLSLTEDNPNAWDHWKFDDAGVNVLSGDSDALDIEGGNEDDGANVVSWEVNDGNNQKWGREFVSTPDAGETTAPPPPPPARQKFYIVSQVHNKVVGIKPGTDQLEIQQKADPSQESQLFYEGDEGFLRSAANDLTLSAQHGSQLSLTQDNHNAWEHWKFDDAGDKVIAGDSNVLGIDDRSEADGAKVVSWHADGTTNQSWRKEFVSLPEFANGTIAICPPPPPPPPRQKFYIVSQVHGKVVGIRPGTNQLEIQQKADPTQDSQLFYDGDDGFLRSAANNLSLSAQQGAQLTLTEDGPNAWDHWKFNDAGVNVLSGDSGALDIEGGNEGDGTNVISWEGHDGIHQKWGKEFVPSFPSVSVKLPPVDVSLPPVDVSLPPVDVSLPPVDVSLPPVDVSLPPVDVSLPSVGSGDSSRQKFYIVSQVHNKVVGIRPGTNQLEIQQKADPPQESQLFYDGDEGFLRSAANNLSLSAQKGQQFSLTQDNHNAWDHWKFEDAGDKVIDEDSNVLGIDNRSEADGAIVKSWFADGTTNQRWRKEFAPLPQTQPETTDVAAPPPPPPPPARQEFYIVSQLHGKFATVNADGKLEIQPKAATADKNQLFFADSNGYLHSAANDLALTSKKGDQFSLSPDSTDPSTQWKFDSTGTKVVDADGNVLDIQGGSEADGVAVVSWEDATQSNQLWNKVDV